MFTGIVEEVGSLVSVRRGAASARLTVDAPLVCQGTRIGDSIAINGTCLTVVAIDGTRLTFDAVPETVSRTSLKIARTGDGLNLERALALGQRLGGHLVQGHVDGTGELLSVQAEETARILRVAATPDLLRYLVPKGSVTLDGVSLTVVDLTDDSFTVSVIPHTYSNTNLYRRRIGDPLNIETDLIGRYIERFLTARQETTATPGGLTAEKLLASGFMD